MLYINIYYNGEIVVKLESMALLLCSTCFEKNGVATQVISQMCL